MILVDSNVLLDLIKDDSEWTGWSMARLDDAALQGPVLINPIIYAELSAGYSTIEALDEFIAGTGLRYEEIPREALFLAAKAFVKYRRAGGTRTAVLPDFFIGAHSVVADIPLLTRDAGRYRTYFPKARLITPSDDHYGSAS